MGRRENWSGWADGDILTGKFVFCAVLFESIYIPTYLRHLHSALGLELRDRSCCGLGKTRLTCSFVILKVFLAD